MFSMKCLKIEKNSSLSLTQGCHHQMPDQKWKIQVYLNFRQTNLSLVVSVQVLPFPLV